jgi:CRP-like cAMP-binding protein
MLARKDWLPAAVRAVGVKRKLKAGQTLFRLGSRTVGLYEVLSGNVRLVRSESRLHHSKVSHSDGLCSPALDR